MRIFLRSVYFFLFLVFCWSVTQKATAAGNVNDQFETVYDLQNDWLFYSADDQSYLPYIPKNEVHTKAIHFKLDLDRFPGDRLIIHAYKGLSLLVQNQYIGYFGGDTTTVFSLDSLKAHYGQPQLWITLYHPEGNFKFLYTYIGKQKIFSISRSPVNEIVSRQRNRDKSLFSIIIIVIFGIFTWLLNVFPQDFKEFFNVSAVFTLRSVDEDIYKSKVLSKTQLVFLFGHSLLLSYLMISFFYFRSQQGGAGAAFDHEILPWWIYNGVLWFGLILFKYLLVSVFSFLFDMRDKINLYFFDFIKLSVSFYSAVFLFVIVVFFSGYHHLENTVNFLIKLAIIFSFVRFIILYFKLRGSTSIKNLHLFSYLCSTELLPIVLGMRYFLN